MRLAALDHTPVRRYSLLTLVMFGLIMFTLGFWMRSWSPSSFRPVPGHQYYTKYLDRSDDGSYLALVVDPATDMNDPQVVSFPADRVRWDGGQPINTATWLETQPSLFVVKVNPHTYQ